MYIQRTSKVQEGTLKLLKEYKRCTCKVRKGYSHCSQQRNNGGFQRGFPFGTRGVFTQCVAGGENAPIVPVFALGYLFFCFFTMNNRLNCMFLLVVF